MISSRVSKAGTAAAGLRNSSRKHGIHPAFTATTQLSAAELSWRESQAHSHCRKREPQSPIVAPAPWYQSQDAAAAQGYHHPDPQSTAATQQPEQHLPHSHHASAPTHELSLRSRRKRQRFTDNIRPGLPSTLRPGIHHSQLTL